MRLLKELVDADMAGLKVVRELFATAARKAEIIKCAEADGDRMVVALQLETRHPLGAIAHSAGAILIDHGWLRILGAGCERVPRNLADWNQVGQGGGRLPGALLVADDAVGGFFALNQGGLVGNPGDLCWLSPQSLEWTGLGLGYEGFLRWALTGSLAEFYAPWRWPTWEDDVKALAPTHAFAFDPPAAIAGPALAERPRSSRPVDELWTQHSDTLPRLLRAPPLP